MKKLGLLLIAVLAISMMAMIVPSVLAKPYQLTIVVKGIPADATDVKVTIDYPTGTSSYYRLGTYAVVNGKATIDTHIPEGYPSLVSGAWTVMLYAGSESHGGQDFTPNYRKDGQVGYARARHLGADKRFYYHQQSITYVNSKLGELSSIEHDQALSGNSIEQSGFNLGLKGSLVVGPPGFEPESIEPKSTSLKIAIALPSTALASTVTGCDFALLEKQNQQIVSRCPRCHFFQR